MPPRALEKHPRSLHFAERCFQELRENCLKRFRPAFLSTRKSKPSECLCSNRTLTTLTVFALSPVVFCWRRSGLIIILNLSIGMVTPPYGITLFVASSIAERSIVDVSKKLLVPLSLMFLVLFLATYFPQISLYLPSTVLGYK